MRFPSLIVQTISIAVQCSAFLQNTLYVATVVDLTVVDLTYTFSYLVNNLFKLGFLTILLLVPITPTCVSVDTYTSLHLYQIRY